MHENVFGFEVVQDQQERGLPEFRAGDALLQTEEEASRVVEEDGLRDVAPRLLLPVVMVMAFRYRGITHRVTSTAASAIRLRRAHLPVAHDIDEEDDRYYNMNDITNSYTESVELDEDEDDSESGQLLTRVNYGSSINNVDEQNDSIVRAAKIDDEYADITK